jgi:NADPH-dependent 7-cyano-7-deazaguanine reductase QueF
MSAQPDLLSTVHDLSGSRVEVTAMLAHRCPHVPEVDAGTVTVSWRCHELTVELHSLAAYFSSWADQKISHEEITMQIRLDLERIDGIEEVDVSTEWVTAGMSVVVSS